jgi:hypothetical protein
MRLSVSVDKAPKSTIYIGMILLLLVPTLFSSASNSDIDKTSCLASEVSYVIGCLIVQAL